MAHRVVPDLTAAGRNKKVLPAADPRAIIIFACLLSIFIACLNTLAASLCALGLGILCALIARPPLAPFLHGLATANIFILFIWMIVPWTTPGPELGRWWVFTVSKTGLDICLLVSIKANALVLIFLSLIAPMPVSTLAGALRGLHCPSKLAWLFLLMGRNVHLLRDEWNRLGEAAKLRGFQPGTNKNTYRTFASMLALLLMRSQDRAERMREAMLLRGFTGKLPQGPPLHYGWLDFLLWLLLLLCLCLLTWMEYGHEF